MTTTSNISSLIDDIMLIIRNSNITESENISNSQIEQWIHQYRATLIKQDIDRGRDINEKYVQRIPNIPIVEVENEHNNLVTYKCSIDIPNTIDFHFLKGITNISDQFGNEIQLMSNNRSAMQRNRRYSSKDSIANLVGNTLYIISNDYIQNISISGVFENPTDLCNVNINGKKAYDYTRSTYPIPYNMIPVLRQMILSKELGIMTTMPTDNKNNTALDVNAQQNSK